MTASLSPEQKAEDQDGRDPSGQALAASPSSPSVSPLTGFDPSRIAEVLADGDGFWRTCSGCHEMCEGHDVGHYPYDGVLKCQLGGGCGDCGGLGVIWDNTDYDEMVAWSREQDAIEDSRKLHLSNMARGLCEVLNRLKLKTPERSTKTSGFTYAEVPEWLLRQWLERVGILQESFAQGIEARSDETLQAAQPERQEPDPAGMRPTAAAPGVHP